MTKLTDLTITQTIKGLKEKEFTATEVTKDYISQIEKYEDKLNAFVTTTPEIALTQAKKADENIANGKMGLLEGIPLAFKDLYCTKDIKTTACSNILNNFVPKYESTVTQNLFNQGAVMLGKLQLDEFAMGASGTTSFFGNTISPWKANNSDKDLVPGGSSSGSATAVSARMVAAATGTDTGGSIRQPSAFCGVTGIKPTYGRCSRWGIVAYASSLDQAGPIAKDVSDTALMLQAMAGFDEKDSTSANIKVPNFPKALTGDIKGLKIGIPKEYRPDGLNKEICDVWDKGIEMLKEKGAEIIDISLPHTKYALASYYIIAPAEASANLARYDGVKYGLRVDGKDLDDMYMKTRAQGFGEEVRRRVMIGTYVLSAGYYDAYYLKAQKVRALIKKDFEEAYKKVDIVLTPATPTPAFEIGDKSMEDPINMWLNDIFTVTVNLAGLPGLSLPVGMSSTGLPLGLQLIGRPFDEATILNAGYALEQSVKFDNKPTLLRG